MITASITASDGPSYTVVGLTLADAERLATGEFCLKNLGGEGRYLLILMRESDNLIEAELEDIVNRLNGKAPQ